MLMQQQAPAPPGPQAQQQPLSVEDLERRMMQQQQSAGPVMGGRPTSLEEIEQRVLQQQQQQQPMSVGELERRMMQQQQQQQPPRPAVRLSLVFRLASPQHECTARFALRTVRAHLDQPLPHSPLMSPCAIPPVLCSLCLCRTRHRPCPCL